MNLVTLECRDCNSEVEFGSEFMAGELPTTDEMQQHMDRSFVARCGSCFACNWEVLRTKPVEQEWSLDKNDFTMFVVPAWINEADRGPRN